MTLSLWYPFLGPGTVDGLLEEVRCHRADGNQLHLSVRSPDVAAGSSKGLAQHCCYPGKVLGSPILNASNHEEKV